jgi:hypothetical protein
VATDQRQRPSRLAVVSIALACGLLVAVAGGAFVIIQSRSSSDDLTMSHPLPESSRGDRGPVRHDLEPLTKRFAALGSPTTATWQGGVLGSRDAPGPSTYWIEAVIHLDQGRGDQLVAEHPGAPGGAPVVDEALATALPDGPWVAGPELDRAFEADGYRGRVFVAPDDDAVVILTIRQP